MMVKPNCDREDIYVYMYVCICIYVYMYICLYVCMYICIYVYMYIRIYLAEIHKFNLWHDTGHQESQHMLECNVYDIWCSHCFNVYYVHIVSMFMMFTLLQCFHIVLGNVYNVCIFFRQGMSMAEAMFIMFTLLMLNCNVYNVHIFSGKEWVRLEPTQHDVHFHHFPKEYSE